MSARLLLVDNYDSFTYNLVQAFLVLGADVRVFRNDELTVEEAREIEPTHLVISPGPGRPEDAGISLSLICEFAGQIPVLGVCLGHQCIVQYFGGRIIHASRLMHGKTSAVDHDGLGIFEGVPRPFEAGRYHSLAADREVVPDCLDISATTSDGEIMGVRHREWLVDGVQFHPESVLTPDGPELMGRFLEFSGGSRDTV